MNLEKAHLAVTGLTIEEGMTASKQKGYNQRETYPNARKGYVEVNEALLDPLYWECLGVALGWIQYPVCKECGEAGCLRMNHAYAYTSESKFKQHQFLDELQGDI